MSTNLNNCLSETKCEGGHWSPLKLRERVLNDLWEIARAMRSRRCEAPKLELVLAHQLESWRRYGVEVYKSDIPGPEISIVSIVRQVMKLPGYVGINRTFLKAETERYWRACTLAQWLFYHAGTDSAETAVRAVEDRFAQWSQRNET